MDLVVISLEPWDEVWRRNQHLIAGLLGADPDLRVLFVEPAADPLYGLRLRAAPEIGRGLRRGPHLPGVGPDALWLHQPTKLLPRRVDPDQDSRWAKGVRRAAERLGFDQPALWVNDPHGALVLTQSGWSALYDITDDWLEADRDEATHARLVAHEDSLMQGAVEVVVCSTGLERTKSLRRPVTLLQNAVDVQAAHRPTVRPPDLPAHAVAVYVGTLHGDRLDVDLCVATAEALADTGDLVLVGPNALTPDEDARLAAAGVLRLGAKDRRDVPAYLQHADVLVVPHVVDDFTESLDPIKLYEYRAVGRPVVSTPVSGFREAAGPRVRVVPPEEFAAAVRLAVPAVDRFPVGADTTVPTWADRVIEMQAVVERVAAMTTPAFGDTASTPVPADERIRLAHAAVQWLADEHGVDVLHIKGHSLDPRLIHPGRAPSDVDVLIRPTQIDAFVGACTAAGFRLIGRFATSSPFEHSVTLVHDVWGYVDVHRLFPGIGASPEDAFDHLWRDRVLRRIGGIRCASPSVTTQIVILVLHAARSIVGGQASRDVEQAWHGASMTTRDDVRREVRALHAEVAFAAGIGELETVPMTKERERWAAMTQHRDRLSEWRARIAAAPDMRSRIRLIARLPLVNTDHLSMQLGRPPTRDEIARAFVGRGVRGIRELVARVRRSGP